MTLIKKLYKIANDDFDFTNLAVNFLEKKINHILDNSNEFIDKFCKKIFSNYYLGLVQDVDLYPLRNEMINACSTEMWLSGMEHTAILSSLIASSVAVAVDDQLYKPKWLRDEIISSLLKKYNIRFFVDNPENISIVLPKSDSIIKAVGKEPNKKYETADPSSNQFIESMQNFCKFNTIELIGFVGTEIQDLYDSYQYALHDFSLSLGPLYKILSKFDSKYKPLVGEQIKHSSIEVARIANKNIKQSANNVLAIKDIDESDREYILEWLGIMEEELQSVENKVKEIKNKLSS
ncbi:MAG: hypothetical protein LC122_13985 [Chitinophagales bacterium]|nr:hypothetical protein [Chitinophagales bacterium]